MKQELFNESWQVSKKQGSFGLQVNVAPKMITLPYDPVIFTAPTADAIGDFKVGYFNCGSYEYIKKFDVPAEWSTKKVILQFDGVYRRSQVYVNSEYAGGWSNGYTQFFLELNKFLCYGEQNTIKVIVHTTDDERWYCGAGIYRDVNLLTSELIHITPNGVKIKTENCDKNEAIISVSTIIKNESAEAKKSVKVKSQILDADKNVVAEVTATVTTYSGESEVLHQRLYIASPKLWNVEAPNLYTYHTEVRNFEDTILDEADGTFGIRSLKLDVNNGLRINDESVLLRGACIHHDNGPAGAISTDALEERRVRLLKEGGFNAIRTAHNPASPALLRACDSLGLLVMEEAFDTWTLNKSDFDYASDFPMWWEKDLEAMINKSYNNPSVILYSIGNEIADTGNASGSAFGRKIANRVRELDSTRFITNGINGMVSCMELMMGMAAQAQQATPEGADAAGAGQSGEVNSMMNGFGDMMKQIVMIPLVGDATAESYSCLDLAGYNYADTRYEMDRMIYPNRVIVGTETFPADIDTNWKKVKELSHVVGDFSWTGWDYIGEAGIGHVRYKTDEVKDGIYGVYPSLTAMCGDISISGYRRPVSYYREIVFGLRKEPYIAVQRPEHYGETPIATPWCWSDSVSGWTWNGFEGKPIKIEVYSDADEVELLCNNISIGRAPVGESNRFKAIFDTVYTVGTLTAQAYRDGKAAESYSLFTAVGDVKVFAKPDKTDVNIDDIALVSITFCDEKGETFHNVTQKVSVTVTGEGELYALGTDDPKAFELFSDTTRTTFDGRALAVIRATAKGDIKVEVKSENGATHEVVLLAK